MNSNKKIAIVGAGGNGSWLLHHIAQLERANQIPEHIHFTVFDGDDVEKKNTSYQDYTLTDVLEPKAAVMASRYDFITGVTKYVTTEKTLEPFDIIICCVDNRDFRELLFKHVYQHPEKYWIDVRAEGQSVVIYSKSDKLSLDDMLKTLPEEGTKATSCQREFELSNGIIQLGNRIAAVITAQYLLNHLRGEENPAVFNHIF